MSRLLPSLLLLLVLVSATRARGEDFAGLLSLPPPERSGRTNFQDAILPGKTATVSSIDGSGVVRHFWTTFDGVQTDSRLGLGLVLLVYSDGKSAPDLEVPIAPFFGHFDGGPWGRIESSLMHVTRRGGLNSYFPIPYAKGLRIDVRNETTIPIVTYFITDYHEGPIAEPKRFHALYRRENPAPSYGLPYLLGRSRGRGFLAGAAIGIRAFDRKDDWFHNGGEMILLDGGTPRPAVLSGIGGEDFFGQAYGMEVFTGGDVGAPVFRESKAEPHVTLGAYRFFRRDPIPFAESFTATFGAFENDMASVLYWYQEGEPAWPSTLPPAVERLPAAKVARGAYDLPRATRRWDTAGPFDARTRADFEKAEFPEKRIDYADTQLADFFLYDKVTKAKLGPPTMARWHRAVESDNTFVDLRPFYRTRLPTNFSMPHGCAAYALTRIESPTARTARVRVTHDDWFRLWLNGKLLYDGPQHGSFRSMEIDLPLAAGENVVLVKAANQENQNLRTWVYGFDLLGEEPR